MSEAIPIAILASGRGSNFEAIVKAIQDGLLPAKPVCLLSDRSDAPVLERARAHRIESRVVCGPPRSDFSTLEDCRKSHEQEILNVLQVFQPRFLVLAGYQRILGPTLIGAFESKRGYNRIVNIHPSLLPAFPGLHAYARAFSYGVKVAGVTVHLVDEQVDHGPICAQQAFEMDTMPNAQAVEARGLEIEHVLYPQTLSWVLPERFRIEQVLPAAVAGLKPRGICVRQG